MLYISSFAKYTIHLDHYDILAVSYHRQRRGLVSLSRPRCHLHILGTEGVPKWTPVAPHIAKGNVKIFLHQIRHIVFYLSDNLPSRFLQCLLCHDVSLHPPYECTYGVHYGLVADI